MVHFSARGYDVPVAGFDEASARSVLAAMQDRLARDPASALGLVANATAEDVRAAFLQLTKRYHPVRFGRMAPDIQRLSNEVFLALRAAHDALGKAARRASGPIPAARGAAPASSQPLSPRSTVSPN
jgi:curved DNA-binding protein CbpA